MTEFSVPRFVIIFPRNCFGWLIYILSISINFFSVRPTNFRPSSARLILGDNFYFVQLLQDRFGYLSIFSCVVHKSA